MYEIEYTHFNCCKPADPKTGRLAKKFKTKREAIRYCLDRNGKTLHEIMPESFKFQKLPDVFVAGCNEFVIVKAK